MKCCIGCKHLQWRKNTGEPVCKAQNYLEIEQVWAGGIFDEFADQWYPIPNDDCPGYEPWEQKMQREEPAQ